MGVESKMGKDAREQGSMFTVAIGNKISIVRFFVI